MKKIVLLDPHVDDFIFTPVSFLILRRRALHKYGYIAESFQDNLGSIPIAFSYRNSSLPISKLPQPLKVLIIFLEIMVWKAINRQFKYKVKKLIHSDTVLFFGYKKLAESLIFLQQFDQLNQIFIHLSHYHTFDLLQKNVGNEVKDKICFCFDNDISDYKFFKDKVPWYGKPIKILPFCVSARFFDQEIPLEKQEKVAVTGTYHDFSLEEAPFDWGIYNRGRLTLHPLRHELAQRQSELPENFEIRVSKFDSAGSAWKKIFTLAQKNYFSFDIAKFYSDRKVAVVAGEGTGAIAIGALEAMASGCLVVLSDTESKQGLFSSIAGFICYDGSYEGLLVSIRQAESKVDVDPRAIRDSVRSYGIEPLKDYFYREFLQ